MKQTTKNIIMIRPKNFGFNEQTAVNNSFQQLPTLDEINFIKTKAIQEFDQLAQKLMDIGVNVTIVEDTDHPIKPDAVFPNNWITLHEEGYIVTYPMFSKNRRIERRKDIIDQLKLYYKVKKEYTFEFYEAKNTYLEGTGSMILDRQNKIVYACLSPRTNIILLEKFCVLMGYKKQVFHAYDNHMEEIYHTNVMMALGEKIAVICLECIHDLDERKIVKRSLEKTGKHIIEISLDQVSNFAGNMLEVRGDIQSYLVMSTSAFESLTQAQIASITEYVDIVYNDISTIEKYGGGSVRCMMAENFLPERY